MWLALVRKLEGVTFLEVLLPQVQCPHQQALSPSPCFWYAHGHGWVKAGTYTHHVGLIHMYVPSNIQIQIKH